MFVLPKSICSSSQSGTPPGPFSIIVVPGGQRRAASLPPTRAPPSREKSDDGTTALRDVAAGRHRARSRVGIHDVYIFFMDAELLRCCSNVRVGSVDFRKGSAGKNHGEPCACVFFFLSFCGCGCASYVLTHSKSGRQGYAILNAYVFVRFTFCTGLERVMGRRKAEKRQRAFD